MTRRFDERRVVAVVLFVLAAARLIATAWPSSAPANAHVHEDPQRRELAVSTTVLDGLATGDTLGGLVVEHVGTPRDHAIAVELTDGAGGGVRIWVRARTRAASPGPVQTQDFDLVFGNPRPGLTALSADVALTATEELGERLSRARPDVPAELR